MGKFVNGVLGTCTGKVGGVVGRTWKGINTVASYQPNVSNPRTNAQVGQRTKMTGLTQLASQLNTGFIKPLWDRDAKKMSGFNAFIQANMSAITAAGVLDFTALAMAKGKITATPITDVIKYPERLSVQFNPAVLDAYGLPSDKAFIAVINSDGVVEKISSGVVSRESGNVSIVLDDNEGFEGFIYLAFRRADGSMTSAGSFFEVVAA